MANLSYLTPDRAQALLTSPPSLEVLGDRINQLEAYLTDWFNFRFPETDYVEHPTTRTNSLTLRNYPVVRVDQVRYALPSVPGAERSYSAINSFWIGDRTVRVPFPGVYQCSYRAGYGVYELAMLEPFLIQILSRWDETGGLGWLTESFGDVIEVSLPGGISQKKQLGNANTRRHQTEGDRIFAAFGNYRRRMIT